MRLDVYLIDIVEYQQKPPVQNAATSVWYNLRVPNRTQEREDQGYEEDDKLESDKEKMEVDQEAENMCTRGYHRGHPRSWAEQHEQEVASQAEHKEIAHSEKE